MTATTAFPPGPKGNLLFRPPVDLRSETHLLLQQIEKEYGGIARLKAGPFHFVVLSNPDYIEHMFMHRDTYIKINEGGNLRFLLGNGLLTSEGEFWHKQRRLIQPVFHKQKLQGFVQKIAESTDEMIHAWTSGETIDIYRELNRVTLDIVGKTLLSTNVKGEFSTVSNALTTVLEAANRRRGRLMRIPTWMPTPTNLRMKRNKQILDDTITDIINRRRAEKTAREDLLTMLMEVEDADTAERMTDKQLRDEVLTIFIAGHETTANALAFTFHLLATHPEVKKKLVQEFKTMLEGKELTYDLLAKMEYSQMVLKESMRLYPPAWVVVREAAKDDVINGYTVKQGDKIIASPYVMQHNEKYWCEPEKFNPERFRVENFKTIPKFAYFPFGGGARICIGNNFAMMEMQIILALTLLKYDVEVAPGFNLEIFPLITLRPKNGIRLNFTAYKQEAATAEAI